jgi:molecular chaperone GrpE
MEKSEAEEPRPEQKKNRHKSLKKPPEESGNSKVAPTAAEGAQAEPPLEKVELSNEEISELRKKASEYDELLDQCKRIKAEYSNYQKRTEKERDQWSKHAHKEILLKILPVIDDLQRTRKACDLVQDTDSIRAGIEMLCASAEKILEGLGVKAIKSVGEKFDPTLHEALLTQETDEFPEGTVISEVEPGYLTGDSVLRPSKVIVSAKPKDAQKV